MVTMCCADCGRTYSDGADAPWRCECGHALDFATENEPPAKPGSTIVDSRPGLWTFANLLPIEPRVTLGEGMTPLVESDRWNASFKLEYVFPTGSFKDRGATAAISRALSHGVERVLEDSSGNAGQAIATYAARAGIKADIYIPATTKPAKRRAIERTGATVVPIDGTRTDVTAACIDAVESGAGWYASHAWDPAFYAGTSTMAYEIAYQRDWTAPDAVVLPVGHGTLLIGAYRGFRTLLRAGWIESMPSLIAGQAAGSAPIVEAIHGPEAATGSNAIADGIQIEEPARLAQVIDAIETTGGDAIAVDTPAVEKTLADLHEEGFYTEPTGAVGPAALEDLRERGALDPTADIVVPLTGSGLKS